MGTDGSIGVACDIGDTGYTGVMVKVRIAVEGGVVTLLSRA